MFSTSKRQKRAHWMLVYLLKNGAYPPVPLYRMITLLHSVKVSAVVLEGESVRLGSGGTVQVFVLVGEDWNSSLSSGGASLPNQSIRVLWTWRRHLTKSLGYPAGVWGVWPIVVGHSVTVQSEKDLGLYCHL